ncbi:sulfotransferase family protein [Thalassococcus profundi]|uniref:Sulfotransferase family protein n=1 Tax=Thalassococcus profundi TaxID=2282382 RepID=A0A369TK68_9RHOB|nr:sulfotransferase family protein [Thalassococcus profundi]RDD65054.1 sulfotransferase family protein [Thalassococcus profundi]
MALEIIGAGFGRTGTDSLREALAVLGFGPCHHMHEIRDHPEKAGPWHDYFCDGAPLDLDLLFDGYRSQVDWPGAHLWRESAERYPNAKVILSVRDPEGWYASYSKTIKVFRETEIPPEAPHMRQIQEFVDVFLGDRFDSEERAIKDFEAHVAEVKSVIPANRLLVYELGSGWEPLCEFLGVSVPEQTYPHTNATTDFQKHNIELQR